MSEADSLEEWSDEGEWDDVHGPVSRITPISRLVNNDVWYQRCGTPINICDMTFNHLHNALALLKRAEDPNDAAIDRLDRELARRVNLTRAVKEPKPNLTQLKGRAKREVRGIKQMMLCHCGQRYEARVADLKRGWGFSCTKRCAAIRREFGRKRATVVTG